VPVEPRPTRWSFPAAGSADEHGIVGLGADLEPGTLLAAYRSGIFPMPLQKTGPMAWWSPDPRAIIPLEGLRVSRSLRRSLRRYEIRRDSAFAEVVAACAEPSRPHGWITPTIQDAYRELHRLGWAHSVEAWTPGGDLAGGLYGVSVGGLFAGESMVSLQPDASKACLVALVTMLCEGDRTGRLLDVQWLTPHLESLGAVEVSRDEYLRLVEDAVRRPPPPALA
jgi:leucyl/phenylalanyl-tRNA--protein transferase